MTYILKNVILEVAWSGNAISHKNIDYLLKLVYILICYILKKKMMFRFLIL